MESYAALGVPRASRQFSRERRGTQCAKQVRATCHLSFSLSLSLTLNILSTHSPVFEQLATAFGVLAQLNVQMLRRSDLVRGGVACELVVVGDWFH